MDVQGDDGITRERFIQYKGIVLLAWFGWNFLGAIVAGSEKSLFSIMGEKLSYTVRLELLESVLHKQISWFDSEHHAPGIITKIMSENVVDLNGMTSELIVTIVEAFLMLALAIIGGIVICYQQAVVASILSPIIVGGIVF